MKKILLVLVLGVAAWWYFIGGRKLTEEHVRQFYAQSERLSLERKPEEMCKLLAESFEQLITTRVSGQDQTERHDKEESCKAMKRDYELFDQLGARMGGMIQLDSSYEIHSIDLSADKKRAIVDITSKLAIGGSLMKIRSRSVDTLIRRNGKVLIDHSDARVMVSTG